MLRMLLKYKYYRKTVFTFLLVGVLLFGMILAGLSGVSREVTIREAGASMEFAVEQVSDWLDQIFLDSLNLGAAIAGEGKFYEYMLAQERDAIVEYSVLQLLKEKATPYDEIRFIGIANAGLNRYIGTRGVYEGIEPDLMEKEFVGNQAIHVYRRTVRSYENFENASTEDVLTILYRPYSLRSRIEHGGIVMDVAMHEISEKLASMANENSRSVYLLDGDGAVICAANAQHDMPQGALSHVNNSQYAIRRLDGEEYIVVQSTLSYGNWSLMCFQDCYGLTWMFSDIQQVIMKTIAFLLIAYAVLSLLFSQLVYSPVRSMIQHIGISGEDEKSSIDEWQEVRDVYERQKRQLKYHVKMKSKDAKRLLDLLQGSLRESDMASMENMLGGYSSYRVLQVSVDRSASNPDVVNERDLCLHIIDDATAALLSVETYYFAAVPGSEGIEIAIVMAQQKDAGDSRIQMYAFEMQEALYSKLGLSVSVSIGRSVGEWTELAASYEKVHKNLQQRLLCGERKIYEEQEDQAKYRYPVSMETEIVKMVLSGNNDGALQGIRDFLSYALSTDGAHASQFIMRLYVCLLGKVVSARDLTPVQTDRLFREVQTISAAQNAAEIEAAFADFLEAVALYGSTDLEAKGTSNARAVQKAREFIERNYGLADLSLGRISEEVGLSSAYLGQIFSKALGKSANEYIAELRMMKAAEMLGSTSMTVQDISIAVGILNPSYFYRLFKKYHGLTPAQYREKCKGVI